MVAFTQLCKKVNISVYNDTITLYPNQYLVKSYKLNQNNELETHTTLITYKEVINLLRYHGDELKIKEYVERDMPIHARYHKDSFSEDTEHYHLRFKKAISRNTLIKILNLFERYDLVSADEKSDCLGSYDAAEENHDEKSNHYFTFFNPLQQFKENILNKIKFSPS